MTFLEGWVISGAIVADMTVVAWHRCASAALGVIGKAEAEWNVRFVVVVGMATKGLIGFVWLWPRLKPTVACFGFKRGVRGSPGLSSESPVGAVVEVVISPVSAVLHELFYRFYVCQNFC